MIEASCHAICCRRSPPYDPIVGSGKRRSINLVKSSPSAMTQKPSVMKFSR